MVKKKAKKKPVGSISATGMKPLDKKTAAYMKKNKIGLEFKIGKGDKFTFKIGRKIVFTVDSKGIRTA